MAGSIQIINIWESLECINLNPINFELKNTINDINIDIKKDIYRVEIKSELILCLLFIFFSFEIRLFRATGIPVVVKQTQSIKKWKIIWKIPRPFAPICFDKNILYKKPIILTIKFDKKSIDVEYMRFGTFNLSPPLQIYSLNLDFITILFENISLAV